MSNTSLPTKKPLQSIEFKRGDIVSARGQIAVIVDVLRSSETDNVCLYVAFVHNLGNARPYDVLELRPDRTLGVESWEMSTIEDLHQAIDRRRAWLEQQFERVLTLAGEKSPEPDSSVQSE